MAELSKQALKVDNNQSFPNNNNGAITPSILRAFNTNMIDSMVDEITYNVDSSSWNNSISALNQFSASASGLTTGSLLITASAASNVITFTKGNGTTFNVTVADTTNLTPLNDFTASAQISLNNLNLWTSSYQPVIVNLQASQSIDNTKFNTIGGQSGSWDNTSLNSYTASNDTKWNTLGALSGSFVTESETGSFARTNVSNTFTQANTFTSISASSFVSASEFVGNGSKLTGLTASVSLPILDEGIPQGNAVSMNFTGSGISAIIVGGTAVVSVNTPDSGTINNLTASFNAYTSSTDAKFVAVGASTASLNAFTASFNTNTLVTTASFNAYTQSNDQKWTNLGGQTGSYVTSAITASSLVTASVSLNTITFTKGNGTTFNVTVDTGSGAPQIPLTSLNAFTASQETKDTTIASVTSSLNSATASLFTSTSLSLYSASISGQLLTFTKGNNTQFTLTVPTGSGVYVTGSYGAFQDSTTQSGSANTAYAFKFNTTDVSDGVILSGSTGLQVGAYGVYNLQWSGQLVQGSGTAIVSVWVNVNGIEVAGTRGDVTLASNTKLLPAWTYLLTLNPLDVVELEWASDSANTTWQYLPTGTTPTTPSAASIIASLNRVDVGGGSNSVSNATFNAYTSSLNAYTASQNTINTNVGLSASLYETKFATIGGQSGSWGGGSINTGSFATTGSNVFVGNQIISGTFIQSGSNSLPVGPNGAGVGTHILNRVLISGPSTGETPRLYISGSDGAYSEFGRGFINQDTTNTPGLGASIFTAGAVNSGGSNTVAVYNSDYSVDVEMQMVATSQSIFLADWDNGSTFTYVPFMTLPPNNGDNPAPTFTRGLIITGSTNMQQLTASLQQGYVWVGDASGKTTTVATSSFGGGGAAFPYTGNAVISGSLQVTGSVRGFVNTLSVSSNTASINMNDGNFFTLSLPTSATTHITVTNILPGQTINLQVSQSLAGTGSVAFAPNIKFAGGYDYTATPITGALDLLSFVTFDTNQILATSVKNLS